MSHARILGLWAASIRPVPAARTRGAGDRAQSVRSLAMLLAGGTLAFLAATWISARIAATVEFVQATGGDFAARYFLGDGGAVVGALTVSIGTALLLVVSLAVASLGYLRIARPGPSPLMIRQPPAFFAQPREVQLSLQGKY